MTTAQGWGLGQWGTGTWGLLVEQIFVTISTAQAIGDRLVEVTLSTIPQTLGAAYPGDALNPTSWSVTRDGRELVVAAVEQVDETTFRLTTLFDLGNSTQINTVSTVGLRNAAGDVVPNSSEGFFGCALAPLSVPLPGTTGDLRNVQAQPIDNQTLLYVSGTLDVGAGNDYRLSGSAETVRKLILRRLTIPLGGFSWLPEYGFNLPVKATVSAQDLARLRDDIRTQVQKEPEVVEAGVRVQLLTTGIVSVEVQARLRTGTSVTVAARVVAPQ
jgi:hypothetical protein